MPLPLDNIVRVTVSRQTRTLTRRSFGTLLIAAYHTAWLDRARTYSDPSDMLDDGFTVKHPAYLAAVSAKKQSPSIEQFKIGRRGGAPTQQLRFTPSTPVAGEEYSITYGGVTFTATADSTPSISEIIDAFVAIMAADVDAIMTNGASTAGVQSLDAADFDGVIGEDEISPPRNLTFTFDTHADWNPTTIVVTGIDANGRTITESFAVPDGGNATVTGTRVFAQVTGISVPAQGGIGGTFTVGVGVLFANEDLDFTPTSGGGGSYLQLAADDAGAWFPVVDVSSNLAIADVTAEPDPTLAEDLTAIQAEDADWYGLIVADAQSAAQISAIASWVETQIVIYVAHTMDSACELDVETDICSTLRDAEYLRTKAFYSRRNHGAFPDAALLGRVFPIFDAGPITPDWDFKALTGIIADDLSTDATEILAGSAQEPTSGKNAMVYVELRATGTNVGESVTWGGMMAAGEWADVVQGLDFASAEVQAAAIQPRLNLPRVPFTDEGADLLVGGVRAAMLKAARQPYQIFKESTIVVQATPVADISPAQRQTRFYDGITSNADLEGSIRGLRVRMTVVP